MIFPFGGSPPKMEIRSVGLGSEVSTFKGNLRVEFGVDLTQYFFDHRTATLDADEAFLSASMFEIQFVGIDTKCIPPHVVVLHF